MKIPLSFIFLLMLLQTQSAMAEPFKPLDTPIAEVGKAKFTVIGDDEERKQTVFKLDKLQAFEEQSTIMITREGKNYYEIREDVTLVNNQNVATTTLIEIGEYLKPISYHRLRRSPQGEPIERWEFHFDNPSWNYSEDTYSMSAVSLVFRSFIEQGSKESSFHLWLSDQSVVRMRLKRMNKEQIKIALGEFPCVKIRMVADVQSVMPVGKILALLIQPFMPEFHFWIWEEKPYTVLRAEGALGPPGSPQMLMEVLELGTPVVPYEQTGVTSVLPPVPLPANSLQSPDEPAEENLTP
jgi:hypothetical protein